MDAIEKLHQTVDSFCRYLKTLPKAEIENQFWGPKEVLAHLLFYHETFAQQAMAQINGEPYDIPKGRLHELNAQAATMGRATTLAELLTRFRQADAQLRHVATTIQANEIVLYMKKGSRPRSVAGVITMVEEHIRNHHRALERGEQPLSPVDKLQATVSKFCAYVQALPEQAVPNQTWGSQEILAHLVFYHESFVAQVEGLLAQRSVDPPSGRQNEVNARAVAANQGVSRAELLERLQRADERLHHLAQTHDPQTLQFEIRKGAGLRTLEDVLGVAESHIRNHHVKLRKTVRLHGTLIHE